MSNLIIWDSVEPIPKYKKVILWRGFSHESGQDIISILDLIENNQELIRETFLNWSYNLGEKKILKHSVRDHYTIKEDLSFWWTSAFCEKSNFSKSPQIDNVIKFIAFRNWARNQKINSILVKSSNKNLLLAFQKLSLDEGFKFLQYKEDFKFENFSLPKANIFKAIIWLFYFLFKSRHLRGVGIDLWKKSSANITFFSYLANLKIKNQKINEYQSNFWSNLPNKIIDKGYDINWLHIYSPSKQIPNAKVASNILLEFNKSNPKEVHVFLESFISLKIIFQTLKDWIKICKISSNIKNNFFKDDYLLIIMNDDWHKSFYGVNAISNCLNVNLFSAALSLAPDQKLGFYLQENQSWEIGLKYFWKACNHNELVGVPHSTTRFWDLRYSSDIKIHNDEKRNRFPKPDYIAINGEAQKHYFKSISYPKSELFLVEALRFLHLEQSQYSKNYVFKQHKKASIIVLGDYLMENNEKLIEMLISANSLLLQKFKFIFKPHPACYVPTSMFKELDVSISNDDISILVENVQFAFSSNVTTAALDVYFRGIPLACMIDPNKLNLSPMMEIDKNVFVKTYKEFAKKIMISLSQNQKSHINPNKFFELDSSLPRWLGFIESRLDAK